MAKRFLNIILFTAFISEVYSQTGGDSIYEFLNLTQSGLVSSLGGTNVSLNCNSLNLAYNNPALLTQQTAGSLALNYSNYIAGINYGLAMYSESFREAGNFAAGVTYLNYGSFIESDASGVVTGSFSASEYAFSIIWSWQPDSMFSVGMNMKPILSHLEKYTSFGIAFDFGISWHNGSNLLSAGLVIRNAGFQVTKYAGESRQNLPFEIQAGASAMLAHAPLRFSLTVRHIEKFDLTWEYDQSTSSPNPANNPSKFLENLLRHLIIGAEMIPHKNFYFSAGYNLQRRKELQTGPDLSAAGLSWGFGVNTSVMSIEYGRAVYHPGGSSDHISLIIQPDLLYKKLTKLN